MALLAVMLRALAGSIPLKNKFRGFVKNKIELKYFLTAGLN